MTNHQNDIMDLLEGDTPRQKYEYLKRLLAFVNKQKELNYFKIEFDGISGNSEHQIIQAINIDEAISLFRVMFTNRITKITIND